MFIVDSHCHLNSLNYEKNHQNLDDVLTKAKKRDIKFILAVSTSISNFKDLQTLVGKRKNIALSCGIHPLSQEDYDIQEFYQLAKNSRVVALGETGLDYHYKDTNKISQQISFRKHIQTAISLNKPIIVHSRNAALDTIKILKEEQTQLCGGVLHCFTEENEIILNQLLDIGFYISFSGIITFKNTKNLHKIARYTPMNRILIETDSPYLTPIPFRGKENQPAYTRDIANYLAKLKKIDIETFASITTKNFFNLIRTPIKNSYI